VDQQVDHGADPRGRIDAYLAESGLAARVGRVVPLTGDASDRRYFRVLLVDGSSQVLALHAGPIEFAALPFTRVAELFREVPLPIPAILGHSNALGVVALEDLGDVTLQAHLGAVTPVEHAARYREAVAHIHLLQRRGAELASDRYLPYRIAFDEERLTWELGFFVRHFIEGYRGLTLPAAQRLALDDEWKAIASELAQEPRVLCHRDYHSRNLMWHGGRLHIIDFQDARLGPDTYDLASLLRDSYVDVTEREVDKLIAYFLALKGDRNAEVFRRRFDLMALQRNLKALGTFGYQTTVRANPVYIQYMPRTIRSARAGLDRYRRFDRLREILSTHIDEIR
jgi:aminoglycoside/choline kinase family phosphotransferase